MYPGFRCQTGFAQNRLLYVVFFVLRSILNFKLKNLYKMENNLTTEEIAQVFSMHWGQSIVQSNGSMEGCPIGNALSLYILGMYKMNTMLLLTKLINISDEHAIALAELVNCEKYKDGETFKVIKEDEKISVYSSEVKHETIPNFGFRYETSIYTDCYVKSIHNYAITAQMPYEAYQQLVKWGYSVPLYFGLEHWANGKTPIELGIAIEAEINNVQPPNDMQCGVGKNNI
jgi:hypothetical protein